MNSTSPSNFEPLDLFDIAKLSERSRHALATDFATSGQTARLRAMLAHIPFAKNESGNLRLDTHLLAKSLLAAELPWLPELAQTAAKATKECLGYISNEGRAEGDCGLLATYLALKAIKSIQADPPQTDAAKLDLAKALFLCKDHNMPIYASLNTYNSSKLYGVLDYNELCIGFDPSNSIAGFANSSNIYVFSAAMKLATLGEPDLLMALLDRPDYKTKLVASFSNIDEYKRRDCIGPFDILSLETFWRSTPELGIMIMERSRSMAPENFELPCVIATAMIRTFSKSPASPAFIAANKILGDRSLSISITGASPALSAVKLGIDMVAHDFKYASLLEAAFDRIFDIDPARRISGLNEQSRMNCLREALFSPVPEVRELASRAHERSLPLEARRDGFVAAYSSTNIERHIEAICHCQRIDTVEMALDAIGIQTAQSFPGHRKGLDASLSMWIARKAPLPIFEACLDWFASQGDGELQLQAEAKSWVYNGHETRKKGDLLALCVAEGKVEYAQALLHRLPDLDTRSAKDVAKAMASKVSGGVGSQALSSWETLLLKKALDLHKAKQPEPETEPEAPKRSRSL